METVFVLREGFWREPDSPEGKVLPRPVPHDKPWLGQKRFLKNLRLAETEASSGRFKGMSKCRCCGALNGSDEFKLKRFGMTWIWPCGFAHYVSCHNVRPSLAFQEFINAVMGERKGDKK